MQKRGKKSVESSDPSGTKETDETDLYIRCRTEESAGEREGGKRHAGTRPRRARAQAGAKGHDEGIENKWVRDSAIFRWCRVFRPGDSALSSAPRFYRSPIPSSSLVFIPRLVSRFAASLSLWPRREVSSCRPSPPPHSLPLSLSLSLPLLLFLFLFLPPSLFASSVRPESSVQQLGTGAPRESLVSGCALPLTAFHRKPIETSRISPFGWTFAASLSPTLSVASYHFTSFSSLPVLNLRGLLELQIEYGLL